MLGRRIAMPYDVELTLRFIESQQYDTIALLSRPIGTMARGIGLSFSEADPPVAVGGGLGAVGRVRTVSQVVSTKAG